ncbi:hypothetical protein KSC_105750 [Ktedonobacter sp. SOSP1-52]|uniref:hypothetical protein n=1 Tax=Ktedonobacter sp. SOSP1-52 TaxID=2778366 RepID=UPI0019154058|nr:hypothetical protein [Ktedonobacter sp. SOSP1-52]GHO71683.1 hypothetical protein KSC_105750 [Ktedonobacter sp. SOSP1-52]
MISPLEPFDKWRTAPAVAKIIPNCALVVLPKAFLLCLVSPYDPAMQGFIELTSLHQAMTDPVRERPTWDVKSVSQFGWLPFIRQEPTMGPNARAWRFHP